ncbi:MAG: hypothetical protein O3B87_00450 [bacterium]|nr:hypothetical protein [bacterium]
MIDILISSTHKSKTPALDANDIWVVLMDDPTFASTYERETQAHKPFVDALPELFKEEMNKYVGAALLMQLRSKYLSYCLQNDYVGTVLGGRFKGAFQKELEKATILYSSSARFVDESIKKQNKTDIEWLMHFCLSPASLTMHSEGILTVRQLLLTQPMAIISTPPQTVLSTY